LTFASLEKSSEGTRAMKRLAAICFAGATLAALAACQTGGEGPPMGPPPPPPSTAPEAPPTAGGFREGDFAWSHAAGGGAIVGQVAYGGVANYSCGDVVLLPETPWSAARTAALYGSSEEATVPVDAVRDRTPRDAADQAEGAIYARYARHAQCNAANRFSFAGLPNGAWYIITVATPRAGGPKIALMRRVATYGFPFKTVLK
jgi:hypothetical protein